MSKLIVTAKKYKSGCLAKKAYIKMMHKYHLSLWDYMDFIKHKNVDAIEIRQDGVILKTKSAIKLHCDSLDKRHIFMEILNFGDYEPAELQMIKRFLKKDSLVLDIGANIGWYAINLSRSIPQGKIIAFEPIPKTYGFLKANIALNGLNNVKAYNLGLSNKPGSFNFYYNRNYTGATSLVNIINAPDALRVKCRVERLDDFLRRLKVSRVDFIKCDAEGAEKLVFEGGLETIKKNKPVIFAELLRKWSAKFNYHPNDVINLFKGLGYGCCIVDKARLKEIKSITETTKNSNFCFLHHQKHLQLLKRLR